MWNPIILFSLFLAGAVVLAVMARRAPEFVRPTAVALSIIALLYWLLLRGQTPLTITLFDQADNGVLPAIGWTIDELSWPVTWWLLLLLLVTMILKGRFEEKFANNQVILFVLTAVSLAAVWAYSLVGMLLGWSALLLAWGFSLGWIGKRARSNRFVMRVGLLWTAVLLLWFGAAAVPTGFFFESEVTNGTMIIILLAAVMQMGIWPLSGWRPAATNLTPELALWLALTPAVTGAVLLLRLIPNMTEIFPAGGMLMTMAGLLGLLMAVRQAWARLHLPLAVASFLGAALAHLLLLTAVWGNAAAALALLQLLIVGSGIFYLMVTRPLGRAVWWRWLPPGLALAAMAGLPLTIGLTGHLILYDGLLADGRFILLIVLVFLQMPLLTAGIRLFWPAGGGESEPAISRESVVQDAAMMLLAVVLLSGQGLSLDHHWLSWAAVFLVPVGGLLLVRYTPEFRRTTAAVRHAFAFNSPLRAQSDNFKMAAKGMAEAFREAATILEGDGSLLWLLILILILMLVR